MHQDCRELPRGSHHSRVKGLVGGIFGTRPLWMPAGSSTTRALRGADGVRSKAREGARQRKLISARGRRPCPAILSERGESLGRLGNFTRELHETGHLEVLQQLDKTIDISSLNEPDHVFSWPRPASARVSFSRPR